MVFVLKKLAHTHTHTLLAFRFVVWVQYRSIEISLDAFFGLFLIQLTCQAILAHISVNQTCLAQLSFQ